MKLKELFSRKSLGSRKDGFVSSCECGEYTLDFFYNEEDVEKCKIDIRCGVVMDITLHANHEAYGFLMSCYQDGALDAMEAYCRFLWCSSHLLVMDEKFPKLIKEAWYQYMEGLTKQAEDAAQAVTEVQNAADEALMQEAVKIAEMADDAKAKLAEEVADKLKKAEETPTEGAAEEVKSKKAAKPKKKSANAKTKKESKQ